MIDTCMYYMYALCTVYKYVKDMQVLGVWMGFLCFLQIQAVNHEHYARPQ